MPLQNIFVYGSLPSSGVFGQDVSLVFFIDNVTELFFIMVAGNRLIFNWISHMIRIVDMIGFF
jgi:hypothetical protein